MKRWFAFALCAAAWSAPSRAHATADILVIEVSAADVPAADRLIELIAQPAQRMRLPEAREPARAFGALKAVAAQRVVVLDSERALVHVLHAGDASVLTRSVEAKPDAGEGYVMAFVAYELLGLSAELERDAVTSVESMPASGTRRRVELVLRAGGELLSAGDPFSTALRPTFAAGVAIETARDSRFRLGVLLEAAVLASARVASPSGRLELTRSDGGLRVELAYALTKRFSAGLFARPRVALTNATYDSANVQTLRFGVGLGAELECALTPWLALSASPALDLAVGRSEYRARGSVLGRDPASSFVLALGLAFSQRL